MAIATAWLAATLYVAANRGFGAGDLPAMLLWSLPLGALVALVARVPARLAARRGVPALVAAHAAAVALGLLVGILWTASAASLLGPWIGAFSFPVLACWALGAVAGLLSAATAARPSALPLAVGLMALAVLGAMAWVRVARRPQPMVCVYFRPGTTAEEAARWRDSIFVGPPPPSGVGHSLPPDVQSYSGGSESAQFTFFRGTSLARRDSLLEALRQMPIVERVEMPPAACTTGRRPDRAAQRMLPEES